MADYKATAAQLASIANAIRLKGGTSAALEYPSEWITAIQNLTPSSGGSEITPADPTMEYKVTDTELISIANAIRAKAEISGQLEFPSEFISGINSIPSPSPTIVSWATGTDEEIVAMLGAAHAGTIDLQQDGGWAVGDVRQIQIAQFTDGNNTVHAQQNMDIVITSFNDYMSCGCVMQFDFKTGIIGGTCMRPSSSSAGWNYSDVEMFTITLPALVEALPGWLKSALIEFSCECYQRDGTKVNVSGNKLALRSQYEVFNSSVGAYGQEGDYISYYATNTQRTKNGWWWLRSISGSTDFCAVKESGEYRYTHPTASNTYGVISPFGCL